MQEEEMLKTEEMVETERRRKVTEPRSALG